MRIRHWAGYGCVTARKLTKRDLGEVPNDGVFVKVWGNHECGLLRPFHDESCIRHWLGRFLPKDKEFYDYEVFANGYEVVDGLDTEYAIYKLIFK